MIQRNPAIQFASSDKIKVWQEERLQEELIYLQEHSPFYSGLFRRAGVDPTAIRRIEELQQLPVTTKEDLQRHNEAFLCVPKREIVDYVNTSRSPPPG